MGGPEANLAFTTTGYTNWNPGEPSGFPGFTDGALHIEANGNWNDVPPTWSPGSYLEEWGGQAGQVIFREDTGTTLTVAQLLANDTDVDVETLTITAVGAASANGGTVSLSNGIITYNPAANFNGADSFTYTLSDGTVTTTGTVTFTVAAVNDAPVTDDGSAMGNEDPVNPIPLTLTGSDIEGPLSAFRITTLPANGTLYLDAAGTVPFVTGTDISTGGTNMAFVYFKPNANWNGQTTFQYAAVDGDGVQDLTAALFTVQVNPVNDAPVIALPGANYATFNGHSAASTPFSTVATTQITDVTMEGWVNWNGTGPDNQMLFYNGTTSGAGFGVFGFPDGNGHLSLSVGSGGVGSSGLTPRQHRSK